MSEHLRNEYRKALALLDNQRKQLGSMARELDVANDAVTSYRESCRHIHGRMEEAESQLAEARAEIEAMQWPCTKCGSAWCYFDGAIVCSDCGRPIRDDIELARRKAALLDA